MVSIKNKIPLFCVRVLLALMLILSVSVTAVAAENTGSIRVLCKGKQHEETVYLAGDEYALVLVAQAEVSDGFITYTTVPAFSAYDCDWTSLSASQLREKAKILEAVAKEQQNFTAVGITDSNGCILFDDLQPGLYLLIRTKVADKNADFSCDPAFYSVPAWEDGMWKYDVTVAPKFSWTDPEIPENLPQTGQLKWPIPILLLTGMGFFFVGFEMCYGGRLEDEEQIG